MTRYACLFEAKSIQAYILRSGRLRHVVGASELLDALTPTSDGPGDSLLEAVLEAIGGADGQNLHLSRAAGGAVYLFTDDRKLRDAFRDLWSLAVRQYAPGLEIALTTGEGEDDYAAYQQAMENLGPARNRQPAQLPAGVPVARYAPRTGEPAVSQDKTLGLQDLATHRFRLERFWRRRVGLTARFADLPVDAWPRNLEVQPEDPDRASLFPFLPDNRYLGLLHADGNGLGQLLIRLQEQVKGHRQQFVSLFRDFSDAVTRATRAAARAATAEVLLPARHSPAGPLPARPIVLGGDDLTILLRADLALPFARVFLTAFEAATHSELAGVRERHRFAADAIPPQLTAGAGIAFVKSNHPFHLAHELVEDLAKEAKGRAKQCRSADDRIPPTLAFHRITTACHGDYKTILKDEMTTGRRQAQVQTSLVTYALDERDDLPALGDLTALAGLLRGEDMARGPARQILTLLGQDHDEARRRYARWREVMEQRVPQHRNTLDDLLGRLLRPWGGCAADLPVSGDACNGPDDTTTRFSPLGDVVALLAATAGSGAEDSASHATQEAA